MGHSKELTKCKQDAIAVLQQYLGFFFPPRYSSIDGRWHYFKVEAFSTATLPQCVAVSELHTGVVKGWGTWCVKVGHRYNVQLAQVHRVCLINIKLYKITLSSELWQDDRTNAPMTVSFNLFLSNCYHQTTHFSQMEEQTIKQKKAAEIKGKMAHDSTREAYLICQGQGMTKAEEHYE